MKSRILICSLVAATFGLGATAALAQVIDRRGDATVILVQSQRADDRRDDRVERREERRDDRAERRDDRRDDRYERRDDRRNDWREHQSRRWDSRHGRWVYVQAPPRYYYGARSPEFRRGAHIPQEYRRSQYVIVDHHQHRLSPPPRGQQWVQVGADYVLIAVATGLIANIILNH
jgi:Ni/Co efflux regulator RcnB